MLHKSFLVLSALLLFTGCVSRTKVPVPAAVLSENGSSNYQIVLPDEYDQRSTETHLTSAATALQGEFQSSTGVLLPIVKESQADSSRPALFIGNCRATRAAGFEPAVFPNLTYLIAERQGNIFLAGRDCHAPFRRSNTHYRQHILGSVKATVVFMEKYLGTRFLWPGAIGRETPPNPRIVIPGGLTLQQSPLLVFATGRHYELMYDTANNNFGMNDIFVYGGHSYYSAVPAKQYAKSNPEYFAWSGDDRNPNNNHLCISNPQVQELIYQEVLRKLDEGASTVELAQTDGYVPCQCQNCEQFAGTSDQGEKLWVLHRSLAERLLHDRPGKKVLIISYGPTNMPPKSFCKFPDNVMIEMCSYSPEHLEAWSKIQVPQGFTSYIYNWGYYLPTGFTPQRYPEHSAEQVRTFAKFGIKGVYRCAFGDNMGLEGPNYYVFGKLWDDPAQDPQVLAEEFYQAAFGPCAPQMRKFYQTLFDRLRSFTLLQNQLGYGAKSVIPENPRVLLGYIYSPDLLDSMEKSLSRAEKLAGSDKIRKRLELVRLEFDYAKNLGQILHLYDAYLISPDKDAFERVAQKVEERQRMIASYYDDKGKMKTLPAGWDGMVFRGNIEKAMLDVNGKSRAEIGAPLTWNIKLMREKETLPGSKRSSLPVPRSAGGDPGLELEAGDWKASEWHSLSGIQLGPITWPTRFKVLYDDRNLYFGVESNLPPQREYLPRGRDGGATSQDCLEFFLAPTDNRELYYHMMCNFVQNSYYDAIRGMIDDPLHPLFNKEDRNWNGDWSYRVQRENDLCRTLVTIPFATLNATTPVPGDTWYLNVGRETFPDKRGKPELALWAPNPETITFLEPEIFGSAVFQ